MASALCGAAMGCAAMSDRGQAEVRDTDGMPCFAVAGNPGAPIQMQFQTLYVSERSSPDWRTLPPELWAIQVLPPGASVAWASGACIRYGEALLGTQTRTPAAPLALHRVYAVFVGARSPNETGNLIGYKAEFCITLDSNHRRVAREVPWDAAANRWRHDVCEKK